MEAATGKINKEDVPSEVNYTYNTQSALLINLLLSINAAIQETWEIYGHLLLIKKKQVVFSQHLDNFKTGT